jgi:hypothetical protein
MLLKWFNAHEAVEVGNALADQFIPQTAAAPAKSPKKGKPGKEDAELQKFVQRIDRDARPLRLNIYKRAKLANTFKWKLLQNGVEPALVDELTRMLLVRLAGRRPAGQPD